MFCGACGQRASDPDPRLREFLHEIAEQFLQWDGRLATTFRLLVTRPGELTTEYVAGRRIRYLSPLRVYLTCSVLFFFASALVPRPALVMVQGGAGQTQTVPTGLGESDSAETVAALEAAAKQDRSVGGVWGAHFSEAMKHPATLTNSITANIPRTMFVMVPLFAALVALVTRWGRRRYPQHLAFALHVHAFLYLALTLMLAGRLTTNAAMQAMIELPATAIVAIYFTRALGHVYGGSRRAVILGASTIAAAYFVAFLLAMVLMFGLIVLVQF
jgi:hypothetical protein